MNIEMYVISNHHSINSEKVRTFLKLMFNKLVHNYSLLIHDLIHRNNKQNAFEYLKFVLSSYSMQLGWYFQSERPRS